MSQQRHKFGFELGKLLLWSWSFWAATTSTDNKPHVYRSWWGWLRGVSTACSCYPAFLHLVDILIFDIFHFICNQWLTGLWALRAAKLKGYGIRERWWIQGHGNFERKITESGNYSIASISILLISFFPQMDNKMPLAFHRFSGLVYLCFCRLTQHTSICCFRTVPKNFLYTCFE